MATLDFAGRLILPQPAALRRNSGRRRTPASPATARAALRRRGERAAGGLGGERVYTWLLQGAICLAMAGMVVFFRAPLAEALRALF